jgi:hypothetical protein
MFFQANPGSFSLLRKDFHDFLNKIEKLTCEAIKNCFGILCCTEAARKWHKFLTKTRPTTRCTNDAIFMCKFN